MGLQNLVNPLTGERFDNGKESVTISCETATLPEEQTGVVEVRYGNSIVKFSNGQTKFGVLNLTVQDLVGANAYGIFKEMYKYQGNAKTGEVLDPEGYMFTAYLIARKANHQDVNRIWKFDNLFVTNIGQRNFDRNSEEKQTFQVTCAFSLMTDESVS
jgi:hypothetical protein